ncbi:DUF4326 domain-containing protein [Pseudomonas aeruginosa]|uniref:DUF4326 domain-containing protein n=1 Tax=Pseudomonas aeruginosa TaxID=287 RepID=UPI0008FBB980|nr:DUF4326 domain-containing protein [Pseudomonas aeruginosa]MBG7444453.1 DUF4326 domain-containing protein [Pseudomonas aeruginosa]MDU0517829.1 DUF4326 domain-containing protein [Pseudomonas aeruginosa]OPE38148.1 hypothetical protein APB53_29190 [Pseudomonas aeruginosa]RPV10312.1 DUF4326 domain-containing protein [Pseudomonas aeruginosa]HBO5074396.1 DUF4326 domain-containing protein [Pseudomonas aeruginosa]
MTAPISILVVYPTEFACYSKFLRKIEFYTSKTDHVELISFEDANGFIQKYADAKGITHTTQPSESDALNLATHAILFEDRNCFEDLKKQLKEHNKPTRTIKLQLTIVVNKDRDEPYDIYIGRGTIWGNPYQIGQDGDRDEVIRKFEYDFNRGFLKASENFEKNISILKGKVIACHCKPAACHGDVIAHYINSQDDGE